MMFKYSITIATCLFIASLGQRLEASAVNFQEPSDWTVGDPGSTFQEWDAKPIEFLGDPNAFVFSTRGTPPSAMVANPALIDDPNLSVNSPGFVGSSGGYYSFGGNYSLYAVILNHGGVAGSGEPYLSRRGTRVIVQTAATVNQDPNAGGPASIFADSLELVLFNGSPLTGGENSSALSITEVSDPNLLIDSPFGLVHQQEYIFEFWLPGYTGDFRVQADSIVHSSFQHLRVDTLIVEAGINPDFNGDQSIDGLDLLEWQNDPNFFGGGAGLAAWESQYGSSAASIAAVQSVPEPATLALVAVGVLVSLRRKRTLENHSQEEWPC